MESNGKHQGHYLVNLWQSSEERQEKYWLARSLGANPAHARAMRDWRLSKIERRYGLQKQNRSCSLALV